jgi:hypothetical protein
LGSVEHHTKSWGQRGTPAKTGVAVGTVFCAVVLAISGAPAADATIPTITPEEPVSAPLIIGAADHQRTPAAAAGGGSVLVAWETPGGYGYGQGPDIRAARLGADGSVLDPVNFTISAAGYGQTRPRIAWNGGVYLAVWEHEVEEHDLPCCRGTPRRDIYGARISPGGQVLDPEGFPIAAVPRSAQDRPAVAPLGDGFLVAWEDHRPDNPGIRGARVTTAGDVLDPTGFDIATGAPDKEDPALASDGTQALVVWVHSTSGNADVLGRRVASDGTLLDGGPLALVSGVADERNHAVAAGGTGFLVVWESHRGPAPMVYATRVTAAGVVTDREALLISQGPADGGNPAVASDGSNYVVTWSDSVGRARQVRGRRVSQAGRAEGASFVVASDPSGWLAPSPAIACCASGYLVAWDGEGNLYDIYAKSVPASGLPGDDPPSLVSGQIVSQEEPAVVGNGNGYLAVWSEARSWTGDIYASRIPPEGTAVDGTGIAVSTATNSQVRPQVAWNGTVHFVVWVDYRTNESEAYGARITAAGTVLDPDGIRVSPPGVSVSDVAVSSDGSEFLAVWSGWDTDTGVGGVAATRITDAGTVLNPDSLLVGPDGASPSVGWNGRHYLVAWRTGYGEDRDLYAARISGGAIADPVHIVLSAAAGAQDDPKVSSDGTDFLVAWNDGRHGEQDVYAARISDAGVVLDSEGAVITEAPSYQYVSGLAWAGASYLVVFQTHGDWYLTRVNHEGIVLDPEPVSLGYAYSLAINPGATGDAALVSARPVAEHPYNGATRAFIRLAHEGH